MVLVNFQNGEPKMRHNIFDLKVIK